MCGLAGVFAYASSAKPVDETALATVRDHMRARGPDSGGLWVSEDRRVGLAHRRLAIIDLSEAGHQPMYDPETGNRIVFNGEIYNHRELRSELEAGGHRFASKSDTEVILTLYKVYGPDCVTRLRGMFAFAIFDARERRLVLARDPFGIKPLYVADDGRTVRFASQVKALLAGGEIDTRPSAAGHTGFFLWGSVPEPYTLYQGIQALPAGSTLTIEHDGTQRATRYFEVVSRIRSLSPYPNLRSAAQAQEILAEGLKDTVRHHLLADVPLGVFLSSGLDSCTLAALAREVGAEDLRTVTLGFAQFQGTPQDEVPLAEAAAQHLGSRHSTHWIDQDDFYEDLDHLLDGMDQPTIDGINTYLVCKAAREAGLKVALSGVGGDEVFGGYSEFSTIPQMVNSMGMVAKVPGLGVGFRRASSALFSRFTSPKYAGVIEYGGDYAGAYLLHRALFAPWEIRRVLDPETAREGWEELQTLKTLRDCVPDADDRLKVSTLTSSFYMRNQLLRDTDWASMAHSIEVRTPLVDMALWETTTRLAISGFRPTKRDMAASPARVLPPEILSRPKTGFSVPIREWLNAKDTSDNARTRGLRGWASLLHERAGSGATPPATDRTSRPAP